MRWILVGAAALSLLSAPASAQPPGASPLVESQAAYLVRCKREVIAAYAGARAQADSICASKWEQIVATGPMAEAILTLAPAPGAAFAPAAVRARAAALRGMTIAATRAPAAPGVTISWFRNGEPIPFDLENALRVRGATLATIGCMQFGAGEGSSVYRVTAPGKAPFALTIAYRNAAVASQSSNYGATADFSGRLATLASLRRDGNDWMAACPQ